MPKSRRRVQKPARTPSALWRTQQALLDAWIKESATKIGYEVSFTRHFYRPQALRTLEDISADILAIEKEAEGLLDDLLKVPAK